MNSFTILQNIPSSELQQIAVDSRVVLGADVAAIDKCLDRFKAKELAEAALAAARKQLVVKAALESVRGVVEASACADAQPVLKENAELDQQQRRAEESEVPNSPTHMFERQLDGEFRVQDSLSKGSRKGSGGKKKKGSAGKKKMGGRGRRGR